MTQENLVSSTRNRLKNISRKRKLDFQFVLTRYALERFLYRLSKSKYKNQFVLKGALLFILAVRRKPPSDTGHPLQKNPDTKSR